MEGNAPMAKKKVIHSPKSIALADTSLKQRSRGYAEK